MSVNLADDELLSARMGASIAVPLPVSVRVVAPTVLMLPGPVNVKVPDPDASIVPVAPLNLNKRSVDTLPPVYLNVPPAPITKFVAIDAD